MYHRTQPGSLLTTFLLIAIGIVLLVGWVSYQDVKQCPDPEKLYVTMAGILFGTLILLIVLLLFHSLSVYEGQEAIYLKFGIGALNKRIPFKDIQSCEMVTNPWYWGWGIRKIPHGWMWNIAGLKAVELTLKNGHKFRIGTSDPQTLDETIRARIPKS